MSLVGTASPWMRLMWACCVSGGCLLAARPLIHWFQLESYQFPGYFRTLKRKGLKAWLPGFIMTLALLAGWLMLALLPAWIGWLPAGLLPLLCGGMLNKHSRKQTEKKKLTWTARAKRLCVTALVLWSALLFSWTFLATGPSAESWQAALPFLAFPLLLPLWTALAGLLAWPLEKLISEMYFQDARRILRERPDLIRIGITGSWGKTSVKFILGTMLSERYPTLVTPASFNTPMGVTRVIRTQLEPGHRIFVAEMGARHVGDIKEMCRLVRPEIGVLTSVGPQHLDTFHTQERITRTKYELMEAIPSGGSCFFADDDGIVTGLWEKTAKEKHLAGLNPDRDDVWAENIRVTPAGSAFTLCWGADRTACETSLLGELNIRNIVLCAAVCRKLGMTGAEIARGIRKLKPVEHRLELKRNPGGITVLDDAFNSNIRGAEQAFRVLKEFPGTRFVVTPGMVELGDREEDLNLEFGRRMAGCCDEAILVGRKRSESLKKGLLEEGFPEAHIHVTGSLQEAAALLQQRAHPGDTILFENDLPDNYSEE